MKDFKNESYQLMFLGIFFGLFLGIYLEAHHPQMFRSWDDSDKSLYRGDKVTLHLPEPHATFYKGCDVTYIAGQAETSDNVAFVLLQNCDVQKSGEVQPFATDIFPLRYLDRKLK
jgi:hypothetical protein